MEELALARQGRDLHLVGVHGARRRVQSRARHARGPAGRRARRGRDQRRRARGAVLRDMTGNAVRSRGGGTRMRRLRVLSMAALAALAIVAVGCGGRQQQQRQRERRRRQGHRRPGRHRVAPGQGRGGRQEGGRGRRGQRRPAQEEGRHPADPRLHRIGAAGREHPEGGHQERSAGSRPCVTPRATRRRWPPAATACWTATSTSCSSSASSRRSSRASSQGQAAERPGDRDQRPRSPPIRCGPARTTRTRRRPAASSRTAS